MLSASLSKLPIERFINRITVNHIEEKYDCTKCDAVQKPKLKKKCTELFVKSYAKLFEIGFYTVPNRLSISGAVFSFQKFKFGLNRTALNL